MKDRNKSAVIIGSGGQDGLLLTQVLFQLDYDVTGIGKNDIDVAEPLSVKTLIIRLQPDEIYFLAAYHHSSEDIIDSQAELYKKSIQVNSIAVFNFLEAIRLERPTCKFFYASSSLIFPPSDIQKLTEESFLEPMDPYSLSKAAGMMACKYYREKHNIFASVGILFNHESQFRKSTFVTKKISTAVARIAKEKSGELIIGSLDAIVDWGYAPDYVLGMHAIMQMSEPENFIIATGEEHTIKEYLEIAFSHVGLDYREYVKEKEQSIIRKSVKRIGDPKRLKSKTGWKPSITFADMVCKLVDWEIDHFI
jgi:GDPmannose 4,6-dehydratase